MSAREFKYNICVTKFVILILTRECSQPALNVKSCYRAPLFVLLVGFIRLCFFLLRLSLLCCLARDTKPGEGSLIGIACELYMIQLKLLVEAGRAEIPPLVSGFLCTFGVAMGLQRCVDDTLTLRPYFSLLHRHGGMGR